MAKRWVPVWTMVAMAAWQAQAQDVTNLIPNPGFEHGMASWRLSFGQPGAASVVKSPGAAHAGKGCARLKAERAPVGIDCERQLIIGRDIQRRGRYTVSAYLKNAGVRKGGFGLRVYFHDTDGIYVKMYSGMGLDPRSPTFGWKQHTFSFGAGTDHPLPGGAATCMMRFSIWDPDKDCACDVWIDDVSLRPDAAFAAQQAQRLPSVAVWSEPRLGVAPAADPKRVAELLEVEGLQVRIVRTKDLCRDTALAESAVDLLVLPYPDVYPAMAGKAIERYLTCGGSFVSLAGSPLSRPVFEVDGQWVPLDRALGAVATVAAEPEWASSHAGSQENISVQALREDAGRAYVHFTASPLKQYAYTGAELPKLPPDAQMLTFRSRGDGNTNYLCLELQESDGSRWKHVVALGSAWAEYRVHVATFVSYASKDRGDGLDHFRPEKGSKLWFGLTKGMVGEGDRTFDVADVRFCRSPIRAEHVLRAGSLGTGAALARRFYGTSMKPESAGRFQGTFAERTRLLGAVRITPVPGQTWARGPGLSGKFAGWAFGPKGVSRGDPPKRSRLFASHENAVRVVPLLDAWDAGGRPIGTAALMAIHQQGPCAGGVWAAFGIEGVDPLAQGNDVLRQALVSVSRFVCRGVMCREVRPTFVVEGDAVVMQLEALAYSRGTKPVELGTMVSLTSKGKRHSSQLSTRLAPGMWTPIAAMRIPTDQFDWQRFAAEVKLSADVPLSDPRLTVSLDTSQALRDMAEFLVKEGADDRQFSGVSFVDQRAARGLLGAYEVLGDERCLQAAVNWGQTMIEQQRPDGGYRMGYGITPKGESCYVADGGEIVIGMARLVSYTQGKAQQQFMKSVRAYMGYRDSFRCEGGGIGVGWCLHDYGKRPITKLDKPTRILAPERNTYTIGCTLAGAYAYARLTGDPKDERSAEADADWLMARAKKLHGAFIESYLFAHAFTTRPERRQRYEAFIKDRFVEPMRANSSTWWLSGGGRSALDLDGLVYCYHKLASPDLAGDPRIACRMMEAAYSMFSPHSRLSAYRLMAKPRRSLNDWIYLCFSSVCLPDMVRPMITMKPFDAVR